MIEFLIVDESLWGTGWERNPCGHDRCARWRRERMGREGIDAVVIELNDPFQVAPGTTTRSVRTRADLGSLGLWSTVLSVRATGSLGGTGAGDVFVARHETDRGPPEGEVSPGVCDIWADISAGRCGSKIPSRPQLHNDAAVSVGIDGDPHRAALDVYRTRSGTPLSMKPSRARPIRTSSLPPSSTRVFPPGPTVIDVRMFGRRSGMGGRRANWHYHLWGLAARPQPPFAGMISFFVMPHFGFGGYLAFDAPMRGRPRAHRDEACRGANYSRRPGSAEALHRVRD